MVVEVVVGILLWFALKWLSSYLTPILWGLGVQKAVAKGVESWKRENASGDAVTPSQETTNGT
jgi:hypothetical protein